MKTLKTIIIIAGVILLLSFVFGKIKSCNDDREIRNNQIEWETKYRKVQDSLADSKMKQDSIANLSHIKDLQIDSLSGKKDKVESELLSTKDKASRLLSENKRLKGIKDTLKLTDNCDSLVDVTGDLITQIDTYKTSYDSVSNAQKEAIALRDAAIVEKDKAYATIERNAQDAFNRTQELNSQLRQATRKANKTVSIGISAGYGATLKDNTLELKSIKAAPFIGISVTKTLIRLW